MVWLSDSIVLVCAVLASLASGVLFAYAVCLGMFRVFQMRAELPRFEVVESTDNLGTAAVILEG